MKRTRTVEETFQKKTPLEHILLRPDTYVGSLERTVQPTWVVRSDGSGFESRTLTYVPALFKIFDEVLVNAMDHHVRDETVTQIRVDVDATTGTIRVWNNGHGIPVVVHGEHQVYVPELIFGHLLTSSNYDDTERKITGGRNGYGAKLTNVFSQTFKVETFDADRELVYEQTFERNLSVIRPPSVRKKKNKHGWTYVTYVPDYPRFGASGLEEDVCLLFQRRVFDAAGVVGKRCKVFWNGEEVPIRSFPEYVKWYVPETSKIVFDQPSPRWEVGVTLSETQQFEQVSFVNGVHTARGGTHVQSVLDKIVPHLVKALHKKLKTTSVKPAHVRPHLRVFVRCAIENPAFDSQTKETLITRPSSFGSAFDVSDAFIKRLLTIGLVERIADWLSVRSSKELKKTDGAKRTRLTGIAKLDDANWAGTKRSRECMLILTEGLSAKALAVAGLSVVGRDRYGVYPLRGKLLNVRDASATQVANNAEISELKQILGLKHNATYTDATNLRYGHVVIMTDQDTDGSHIKGLIMNFFHVHFPTLLQVPGFLLQFVTPIVRAKRGSTTRSFYTIPEYEAWKRTVQTSQWSIKYYKGLGTSTSTEAKEYFSDLGHHLKPFAWTDDTIHDKFQLAFSKTRADDRKRWIATHTEDVYLDHTQSHISYGDFVDRELVLFSVADLRRSIPSLVDGWKPGQRKVLFGAFERRLSTDVKVVQFAGYVSERAAYHHGETSLHGTIIGMAQRFVGSNNLNVLVPSGQFGTRAHGGSDAASPRYIFTRLDSRARLAFPPDDDACLTYLEDDGQGIEPRWYAPIVPMVLINGAEGIGTGWRTYVPNFNPKDVIHNLRCILRGQPVRAMVPWYRGFSGTVVELAPGKWASRGIVRAIDETRVEITELPVRVWTQSYKEWLEEGIKPTHGRPKIADYAEYHTETSVRFVVTLTADQMKRASDEGLVSYFRLEHPIPGTQMVLFDADGTIRKYADPLDILADFARVRRTVYAERKAYLIRAWEEKRLLLETKRRFIAWILDGTLDVRTRTRTELDRWLEHHEVPRRNKGYEYLWSLPMSQMTKDRIEQLGIQADEANHTLDRIRSESIEHMWLRDLRALEGALCDASDE